MDLRDRLVVLGLVTLLAALTVAIGAPAFLPASSPEPSAPVAAPSGSASPGPIVGYREGIVGRPESIDPLTARTQVDRDLVALVYSGLVKLGPNGQLLPDLATGWTVNAKGTEYVFTIRADARWQDGEPVTSADVAYTIAALKDPDYTGPGASSWREVTLTVVDDHTVSFELGTSVGGFLYAALQPLLPDHILHGVAPAALAQDPFNDAPVGTGPFKLVSWDATQAHLVRVAPIEAPASPSPSPSRSPSASPSPSVAPSASTGPSPTPRKTTKPSPKPTTRPSAKPSASPAATPSPAPSPTPVPTVPPGSVSVSSIDIAFYEEPTTLIADYNAGLLDAAVGLSAGDARTLSESATDSRLMRYPRTTFTGVVINLRPGHTVLQDVRLRLALLQAIDRSSLIGGVLAGSGERADSPVPPSSWAFAPKAAPAVAYDPAAAATGLKKAGWKKTANGWYPPNAKESFPIQLITLDAASNPTVAAVAAAVAADWRALGFTVVLMTLTPKEFVDDHLATGAFDAAIVDVNVGLDPDLYPFYASTQTTTGGANITGLQVPALDRKLQAARKYASRAVRLAAFKDLQTYLGAAEFTLPLFFRTEPIVLRDRVFGPTIREISDPGSRYWDVLTWRLATGP
jgi:ABC-type transport system substrate-binding protein